MSDGIRQHCPRFYKTWLSTPTFPYRLRFHLITSDSTYPLYSDVRLRTFFSLRFAVFA
ncbi:hypothetical protein PILCRDRAFT_818268 [Piloderma croceum F 1598]|uniref:Uncharacterized protein n=1 Tax=Piloderma croceum (strain F 1598) TaxID=765440 RepID=A0A0C3FKU2_PILCF|nr:hypothetical protein PILCRDRAFT_818268 [Piloderma croceum F 1598]